MINRIDIVSIPVSDQSKAKTFYVDKLGFNVVAEFPMGPDQTWTQLGIDGAQTSITLVTWFESMPAGSVQGLVVNTDNIDDTHAQLANNGVKISKIDDAPWGRFATFADPDGNGLVLQQTR